MLDAIIIGGGPAGLTASIYIGRAEKDVLLLDNGQTLMKKAQKIENYPGFPEGIQGEVLYDKFIHQAEKFGVEMKKEEVLSVERQEEFFVVESEDQPYRGKGLVIATGVSYKTPSIKNFEAFTGRGVSYCVACDGPFFRNQEVIVVGAGNYAAKEALELLDHTPKITVCTNGKQLQMDDRFQQRLKDKGIPIETQKIKKLTGETTLEAMILANEDEVPIDGIFLATGELGTTDIAKELGLETENKFIATDRYCQTNQEKVYACGDCTGYNQQLAIAVGEGANAALNLIADLEDRPRGNIRDY